MESSWYLLHITPEKSEEKEEEPEKEKVTPDNAGDSPKEKIEKEDHLKSSFPQVGAPLVHFLGLGEDSIHSESDEKNVLWDKIQDEARPAWAPDYLRRGYAVIFKREGLAKMAVNLGLKNPAGLTKEEMKRSRKRILTFDDVWVAGCVPHSMPMHFPDKDLSVEDWWLATKEGGTETSPYLAAGGVTVAIGPQRLSDVVISMLRTANGYPRPIEGLDESDDMSEFINPLIPVKPVEPTTEGDRQSNYHTGYGRGTAQGWAGIELFRYAGK